MSGTTAGFTPRDLVDFFKLEVPTFLGVYTYKNGATTPAICVDNVPNDVKVTGFEVIIPGFPNIEGGVNRQGRRTHICQIWRVNLINHDSYLHGNLARKGEFYSMVQTVLLKLPKVTSVVPFQQTDPNKTLQRAVIDIKLSDTYDNLKPLS